MMRATFVCIIALSSACVTFPSGGCIDATIPPGRRPLVYTVNGSSIGDTLPDVLLSHARSRDDAVRWQRSLPISRGLIVLGIITSLAGIVTLAASRAPRHPEPELIAGGVVFGAGVGMTAAAIGLSTSGESSKLRAINKYNEDAQASGTCPPP